jgi:hypothetical protein
MARILQDGAETGDLSLAASITATGGGSVSVTSTTKRSGDYAYLFDCPTSGTAMLETASSIAGGLDAFRSGGWFYIPTGETPSAEVRIMSLALATADRCYITLDASRQLRFYDANGVVGSPSSAVNEGQFYHLAILVNNSAGATVAIGEADLDGTAFAFSTGLTISTIDTVNVGLWGASVTGSIIWDDIILQDQNGSQNIGAVGDDKIVHMRVAGNGDSNGTQGTHWDTGPSTGGTMYQMVDEAPPSNDATDYIQLIANSSGPTVNFHDFTLEASSARGIGASDTITAVGVGGRVAGASGAACSYTRRVKSQASGTALEGLLTSIATTTWNTNDDSPGLNAKAISPISQSDPQAGGAWTPALLDTAQIGVRANDAVPDVLVSALWLSVAYIEAAGGGGGISAEASLVQDANTVASDAAVAVAGALGGAPITQDANSLSSTATVSGEISATVNLTQDDNLLAGDGTVAVSGDAALSQDAQTVAASGTTGIAGDTSLVQGDDTAAGTAAVAVAGSASLAQGDDTVAGTGTAAISASSALVQDDATVASTGIVSVSAEALTTQADQSLSSEGTVAAAGIAALNQDSDVGSGTIGLVVSGTVAATQASDTLDATGAVEDFPVISASVDVTQDAQSGAATAVIAVSGIVDTTQADDAVSGTGTVALVAQTAVAQDDQTLASTGDLAVQASVAVAQDDQTLAASGIVGDAPIVAEVNVVQDDQSLQASAQTSIQGAVDATAAADTGSATGTVEIAVSSEITQQGNSVSATGTITIDAAIVAVQEDAFLTAVIAAVVTGTLTVEQASQTLNAAGTVGALIRLPPIGETSVTVDMVAYRQTFDQLLQHTVTYEGTD